MIYKLIAVVSKDGFIGRYSGDLPVNWTSSEEQNFFKKDIKDCIWSVMGRVTHELSYNEYKKRIIFSSSVKKYEYINKNHIYFNPNSISFDQIIELIKPVSKICILGGTKIYDYFIINNLLNDLVITVEPIIFGKGLPLFSKINWNKFPKLFIENGFKLKSLAEQINNKGTKYYYLSKI